MYIFTTLFFSLPNHTTYKVSKFIYIKLAHFFIIPAYNYIVWVLRNLIISLLRHIQAVSRVFFFFFSPLATLSGSVVCLKQGPCE